MELLSHVLEVNNPLPHVVHKVYPIEWPTHDDTKEHKWCGVPPLITPFSFGKDWGLLYKVKGTHHVPCFIMVIDLLAEVDHDTQMGPLWLIAKFFSFFFWDKRQQASAKAQEAVDHLASFLSVREETSQLRIEPPLLPIFKCANRCTS